VAAFEAWLVFLILVVNVVGELQRKRTLAASRGFLAAARHSCFGQGVTFIHTHDMNLNNVGLEYNITTYNSLQQ